MTLTKLFIAIKKSFWILFIYFIFGFIILALIQNFYNNIVNNILISIIATSITIILINIKINLELTIKDLIICTLSFFVLTSSVFVNIDRSRSFYILSWVNNGEVKYDKNGLNLDMVKSKESINSDAINNRIIEQINRGIIINRDSTLFLSNIGKVIVNLSNFASNLFSLKGWQINKY
jgi:hypothetical protein